MDAEVNTDAVDACPELITIIGSSSLKFNKFVNLFMNDEHN